MGGLTRRAMLGGLMAAPLLARPFAATAEAATEAPALDAIMDRLFLHMPELAVYNGVEAATGGGPLQRRLDDYSPAGEAALRAALREARDKLPAIDAPDDAHLAIARAILDNGLRSEDIRFGHIQPFWYTGHSPYLVNQISGPHIDTPNQMSAQQSVRTPAEAEAYVAKLRAFCRAFDRVEAKLIADAEAGALLPASLVGKTLGAIDGFVAPRPPDNVLVTSLLSKMAEAKLDGRLRDRLAEQATEAVRERVYPAYAALRERIAQLGARAPVEDGIWAQPQGEALYAANVRSLGDTSLSPAEVHKLGLDEVARITAEMDRKLKRRGHAQGSVGERMNRLAAEQRFYYSDSVAGRAALIRDVEAMINRAEALYPRILRQSATPRQHVEVRPVPAFAEESAPGGYYDGPSLNGSRPGIFWINLRDIRSIARFQLPTLTYHEAVPGHHTQGAITLNQGATPLMVRIASFNAFQEGWALYAERLAAELGLYARDPYGDLGRLQDELFRAARLVVDTGLHHQRWTRAQAIERMLAMTGAARSEVTAEVERYMAWPAQALGYKLGQLRLLALRDEAKAALGRRFDIRDFHELVLTTGPAPLDLVAAAVKSWIDDNASASPAAPAKVRRR